jgi:hypothetical protein
MTFKLADFDHLATQYAHWIMRTRTSLHIALVYGRGGEVLAESSNRLGSRSRGAGYSHMTIHAERAVLKKVGDVSLLKGASLVVIRINKRGQLCNSCPCHECEMHLTAAMKKYGLKRVYYS